MARVEYKFEALAKGLSALHKAGNAKTMSAKVGRDYGVPELQVEVYLKLMEKLYDKATKYEGECMAVPRNSVGIENAKEALDGAWKEILKCSSEEGIHCRPSDDDVTRIAGYASQFVGSEANFNLDEGWSCPKTTTSTAPKRFQKKVETLVGIRLDQTERLDDDEVNYLAHANAIVGSIKTLNRNIANWNKDITSLREEQEAEENEAVCAYIEKRISKLNAEIAKAKEGIEELTGNLERHHGKSPEEYAAEEEARRLAKIAAKRAKRDANRKAKREKKHAAEQSAEKTAESKSESAV